MLRLNKSDMVSLSPLVQRSNDVHTIGILVNMLFEPDLKPAEIHHCELETGKVLETFSSMRNRITIMKLPKSDKVTYLFSKDMVGVPIYLSHTDRYDMMSFEHSHPPHEFTVGGYMANDTNLFAK